MKIYKNEAVLCRQGSCCARLQKVENGEYVLLDDFSGSAKLTQDDLILLKQSIEHLENNDWNFVPNV